MSDECKNKDTQTFHVTLWGYNESNDLVKVLIKHYTDEGIEHVLQSIRFSSVPFTVDSIDIERVAQ